MRKFILQLGVAVLGMGLCLLPLLASAMTYRDNTVKMPLKASGYSIVTASYRIDGFYVTDGQDPDGHIYNGLTNTYSGNDGSMTFSIGRKGSSDTANWWIRHFSANQTTFNHDPGKLNFAFTGRLQLTLTGGLLGGNQDTYTLNNIGIAQGHSGSSNNWWFGGSVCSNIGDDKVTCDGTSSSGYTVKFTFKRGGNGVNNIELKAIDYPPYQTASLQSQYRGESTDCVWQPWYQCPPYVTYFSSTQAATVKLHVSNNTLYNAANQTFDTSGADYSHSGQAAIFVLSTDGKFYASNQNKVYLLHHSSLLAGANVAAAGELFVTDGVIQKVTNCSGHYQPGNFVFLQIKEALVRLGYTQSYQQLSCSPSMLKRDLDYRWVAQPEELVVPSEHR